MPWIERDGEKVWVPQPKIEPSINASIWPTKDGQWAMGNLMLCERVSEGAKSPSDGLVTWKDSLGVEYCLRSQTPRLPVPNNSTYMPAIPRHFSSALFEIGCDILVKVKHAPNGWPRTEGAAMRLVQERAPSVPIPEAIYYWVDEEWDRYYVIQRRIHGELLDDVWFKLEDWEKVDVTREIARYIKQISEITAPRFQAADGGVLGDSRLLSGNFRSTAWGPHPDAWPGPFTSEEFRAYLRDVSDGLEPPKIGSEFHFYHCDLSPGNVILTGLEKAEDKQRRVRVAAIIDWEDAGFYPEFWIPFWIVNPLPSFRLSISEEQLRENPALGNQYRDVLMGIMDQMGFQNGWALRKWWVDFNAKQQVVLRRRFMEKKKLADAAGELHAE